MRRIISGIIAGKNHKGTLFTANDRMTMMTWVAKLPGKDSVPLSKAAISKPEPFKELLHTITSDNGKEFAGHKRIAEPPDADFHFAHSYHSWKEEPTKT